MKKNAAKKPQQNHLGDQMPQLPWMIKFDCKTKRTCYENTLTTYPTNRLEFLSRLKLNRTYGTTVLTTIACSLGPKNMGIDTVSRLLDEGVSVLILDTSLGAECDQLKFLDTIRLAASNMGDKSGREFPIAVCLEMAGLRMRTGRLDSSKVEDITLLEDSLVFITFDSNYECHCNKKMIYINNPDLLKVLSPGHRIYIDYGTIVLEVVEIGNKYKTIKCKVVNGGKLKDEAVIHLPNVPLHYENEIRTEIVSFAVKNDIDGLIISRVRNAAIITSVRLLIAEVDKPIMLIARIEDTCGVENIDDIIKAADAILIARGELGIDIPPEKLFIVQKSIIAKCNKAGKPVLCGSPFLKSMVKSRVPSRADMLDLSNAILDGTDVVLLSEELSKGPFYFEAIDLIKKSCLEAEVTVHQKQELASLIDASLPFNVEACLSMAIAAIELGIRTKATCLIVCTVSGRSAKLLAQFKPKTPIIAVTRYGHVARKLNMWRAVIPIYYTALPREDWIEEIDTRMQYAITYGKFSGLIKGGDPLVLVSSFKEMSGFTNTVRVVYATQNNMKRSNATNTDNLSKTQPNS